MNNCNNKDVMDKLGCLYLMMNIKDKNELDSFNQSMDRDTKILTYKTLLAVVTYIYSFDHNKIINFFADLSESFGGSRENMFCLSKVFDGYLFPIKRIDKSQYRSILVEILNNKYATYIMSASLFADKYYKEILKDFKGLVRGADEDVVEILLKDNRFINMLTDKQRLSLCNTNIKYLVRFIDKHSDLIRNNKISIEEYLESDFVNAFHILVEHREMLNVDWKILFETAIKRINHSFVRFYKEKEFQEYIFTDHFAVSFKLLIKSRGEEFKPKLIIKDYVKLFVGLLGPKKPVKHHLQHTVAEYFCELFSFLIDDPKNLLVVVKLFFDKKYGGSRKSGGYIAYDSNSRLDISLLIKILLCTVNQNYYYDKIIDLLQMNLNLKPSSFSELTYSDLVFLAYFGVRFNEYKYKIIDNGKDGEWLNSEDLTMDSGKLHFIVYSLANWDKKWDEVVIKPEIVQPQFGHSPTVGHYIQNRQNETINKYNLLVPILSHKDKIITVDAIYELYLSYTHTEFPYPRPLKSIQNCSDVIHTTLMEILYSPPDPNTECSTWRCGYTLTYCRNKYRIETMTVGSLYSTFKDTSMCLIYNIRSVGDFERLLREE